MGHLATALRIEMDHNDEGSASVLRECREEVLEGLNAAGRGADGDDHRFGVLSLSYGLSLILVIARHDATPRPKAPDGNISKMPQLRQPRPYGLRAAVWTPGRDRLARKMSASIPPADVSMARMSRLVMPYSAKEETTANE